MKNVCQLDRNGYFNGLVAADPSPEEPGVWLIPGGAVDARAPTLGPSQRARWDYAAGDWRYEEVTPPTPDPVPEPTREQQLAAIERDIQARLDVFARSKGYRDIATAISYQSSSVPAWAAEAAHLVVLRDETWSAWYALSASDPVPSWEEVVAVLPPLVWAG